ncbi:MAG TPA: BrnT family toxin [Caulobacteraceae bacterium]|jgi:hypothetical protein|nr:BrnT family toxin [Caulobacteraceae bacterium]
MTIEFEWNPEKARANVAKHGVDFETAAKVFDDPFALAEPDNSTSDKERWRTIGLVRGALLLLVAHTVRDDDDVEIIRIISARRTDQAERRRYERARRESSGR